MPEIGKGSDFESQQKVSVKRIGAYTCVGAVGVDLFGFGRNRERIKVETTTRPPSKKIAWMAVAPCAALAE